MITLEHACLGKLLTVHALFTGSDLWVLIAGGDAPHIGSISVAIPRKSLTGNNSNSATVSTFNVTGHKDNAVGDMFAMRLASEFSCIASVSCGIHYDALSTEALCHVMNEAEKLLAKLVAALKKQ